MQQESDDVIKVNCKTAEENMITTFHPSGMSFFSKNTLIRKAKKNKQNDFIDRLKCFYLPMIPLWIKVHAKQSEKEQIKRNVCKLPIRTIFAESNTNAQVEECFEIKEYSSRLNKI